MTILWDLKHSSHWIQWVGQNLVLLPVTIQTLNDYRSLQADALLDSGAMRCYIDTGYVQAESLNLTPLPYMVPVYNADGTPNEVGPIHHTVELHLQIEDHKEILVCAVTNTDKMPLIIGFDWLHKYNLLVD